VDGFPDALQILEKQSPNDDPLLHLHVTINKGALMDMVALLFEAGPEHAILMRDKDGNTPLHCACIVKAEPAVIEYLHCHYPGATNIQNNDSYKPCEYAFDSNRSHDVTMWLYEEWPEMEKIDMHTLEDDDECAMYRVLPSA
jgi:ankyrin repeat protein